MQRRDFLISSFGAGILAAVRAEPAAASAAIPRTWADVKAEFGLDPSLAHLAAFFLASHPRAVREALETHRRGLDANPVEYVHEHGAPLEIAVRAAAAEYLGVDADELAMTDSTTMGLGLVYGGLEMRPGQEILSTTHDHLATTLACQHRTERSEVGFRQVPLYADPAKASAGAIAAALARAIRPETRVIAVTWVHSGTGVKLPIRALADVVARANAGRAEADRALLVVDGVHGLGLEDAGPRELGCDILIAGCHKWIFGPRGTGLVWARPEVWRAMTPIIPSFDPMWRQGPPEALPRVALFTPGGFHSFEHRWALAPAFRFHLALGRARVAARVHELNAHLKRELARIPRVKVVTPKDEALSAGIVCFSVAGLADQDVVARLRKRGVVATTTPPFYAPSYVRLSAGLVTVESDVERALAALRG